MNKYLFGVVRLVNGLVKASLINLCHACSVKICMPLYVSPYTEITIERKANVRIGKNLKMRSGSKIRVRRGATLIIGQNLNMSGSNWITVRDTVEIGDEVTIGPGTMIYDHDHDYTTTDGIKNGDYLKAPVKIGNNVWIGANCVILRGTEIGDNCVVGAGTVLKGKYNSESLIYQKRNTIITERKYRDNE